MPVYIVPADTRAVSWPTRDGKARNAFHPGGKKYWKHFRPNRTEWRTKDVWAARLFVGFNVGETPVYTIQDLMDVVREVRQKQVGDPSSSFVTQKGLYLHRDTGQLVKEPGAQVIIINLSSTPEQFEKEMIALAEEIAERLNQEEVILEMQHNGISQETLGISSVREEDEEDG